MASLTYNWSPNDPAQAPTNGAPQDNWTTGPMYRAIAPSDSPDRYMPTYSDVVAGNLTPTWEVTPAVARVMNFSFIVRDNGSGFANGIGQTHADLMTVTVEDSTPFTVTTPPAWGSGSTQTVMWNVGNTNNASINCQTVNIKFSEDGGLTFPTTLASSTANDGSESITVPSIADMNNARILVEAADNIFYALSGVFPISSAPSFALNNSDGVRSACNIDAVSYDVDFFTVNGFSETTTFSATGNPAGSSVAFTPATLDADGTTVLDVTGLTGAAVGDYTITITGTSASETKTVDVTLTVIDGLCDSVGTTQYATSTTLVQFGDIDNASGKPSGYSDYTSISTDVTQGMDYPITVNMNTDGDYTCASMVWIDWNQNCIFDSNEAYDLGSATNTADGPTGNSPLTITVPNDAIPGNTIMRVTTKYQSAASSCENSHDAEVEDYTVNVTPLLSVDEFNSSTTLTIYPNPNNGEFNVVLDGSSAKNIEISVFDIRGRRVFDKVYESNPAFNEVVNLNGAQSGMYLLQVSDGTRTQTRKILVN